MLDGDQLREVILSQSMSKDLTFQKGEVGIGLRPSSQAHRPARTFRRLNFNAKVSLTGTEITYQYFEILIDLPVGITGEIKKYLCRF